MKLPKKSADQSNIDIADYYAVKPGSIWRGLKQENAAFRWVCIYLFFEYVRPQSLYPVIDILPYSQISLLLTCIFAYSDRSIKWVSNYGNTLFILFFIAILLSSVLAFQPSTSFGKIDVIINWIVLYFLFITIVNTEKRFILFLLIFFLVNFKMSQFGFRSFITRGYTSFGVSGGSGWFEDSGDLGIEMIIFVSLSAAFVLALKGYWGKYKTLFFWLLPLTGLVTIIATTSRGAQLGMLATGIWFILKSPKGIKWLSAIILIGLVIYSIIPERMLDEFGEAGDDRTSQARIALWAFGGDIVRDYPVLGVGYFNWIEYCSFLNPSGIAGTYRSTCLVAHNTYVTAAAELGIIGLVIYLVLMLFILKLNARTRTIAKQRNNKFILYTAHGLDGGLIGYTISTIFFTLLFYPLLYVQLAMTVALYEISKKQNKDTNVSPVSTGNK